MAGDTLTVIAVGKTWSRVKDPETGKTGYVANDDINFPRRVADESALLGDFHIAFTNDVKNH